MAYGPIESSFFPLVFLFCCRKKPKRNTINFPSQEMHVTESKKTETFPIPLATKNYGKNLRKYKEGKSRKSRKLRQKSCSNNNGTHSATKELSPSKASPSTRWSGTLMPSLPSDDAVPWPPHMLPIAWFSHTTVSASTAGSKARDTCPARNPSSHASHATLSRSLSLLEI